VAVDQRGHFAEIRTEQDATAHADGEVDLFWCSQVLSWLVSSPSPNVARTSW
jgi:hypothetical protein